jgi:hypothetical protein
LVCFFPDYLFSTVMMYPTATTSSNGPPPKSSTAKTTATKKGGGLLLSGGSRLKTGSANRQVYFQVNLQDLDAYTQQVLDVERARRRLLCCRCCSLVLFLGVLGLAALYSAPINHDKWDLMMTKLRHNNSIIIHTNNETWEDSPRTICERQLLNDNMTFADLVASLRDDPQDTKHCRPESTVCVWQNPTLPESRGINPGWMEELVHNKEQIDQWMALHNDNDTSLDVVLIGDSLVEHMQGKAMGSERTELLRDEQVFERLFQKQKGGALDGLALGIAGDRCANVLYRLSKEDLMRPEFAPKVWWLVVGGQDWEFGSSPHAIVAGIAAICHAIRQVHPTSHIVINSLLPHPLDRDSIHQVNQLLECYVYSSSQYLHFFNATSIFLTRDEITGEFQVNEDFMLSTEEEDPDAHGEFLWGERIVKTVQGLVPSSQSHGRLLDR